MYLQASHLYSSVSERFEQIANEYPTDLAIVSERFSWTYAQLNQQINKIAYGISRCCMSASPAGVVLLMRHDAPMIAAMLATLKLGYYYIPLDSKQPLQILIEKINTVDAALILTDEYCMGVAKECSQLHPLLIEEEIPPYSPPMAVHSHEDSLAYILYTSGTTGKAKGVLQNHRNMIHYNRIYSHGLKLQPNDRISLFSSLSYDAAVMDIYAALLNGATLYPFSLSEHSPLDALNWIKHKQITIFHATPTVFRLLMHTVADAIFWQSIRYVVLGGETARKYDFDLYRRYCSKSAYLINGFGPTEATIALQHYFTPNDKIDTEILPIGEAVLSTDIVLLDAQNQMHSEEGEIAIVSDYLALGYWKNEKETSVKFIEKNGKRLYKTGDLGRKTASGVYELISRLDDEVKIRGHKVSLKKVEETLLQDKRLLQLVILCEDVTLNTSLVAYYQAKEAIIHDSIHQQFMDVLAEYMFPTKWVRVQAFPLLPNGKVDKRALLQNNNEMDSQKKEQNSSLALTESLVQIWSALLQQPSQSFNEKSHFFSLGGHSLLSMQLMNRIRDVFQIDMPLAKFLQNPTIMGQAQAIAEQQALQSLNIGTRQENKESILKQTQYPASWIQESIWLKQQLYPQSPLFHLVHTLSWEGAINEVHLESSLKKLMSQYDILRSSFRVFSGQLIQEVHQDVGLPLEWEEHVVSGQSVHDHLHQTMTRPFLLEEAPLFRIKILKQPHQRYVLILNWHHLIADGFSEELFLHALETCYANKRPSAYLEEYSYNAFIQWHAQQLRQNKQLDCYWQEWVDQLPRLINAHHDEGVLSHPCIPVERVAYPFPSNASQTIQAICDAHQVTPFIVLQAIMQILMHRLMNCDQFIMDTPVSLRYESALEKMMGCCVNLVPLLVVHKPHLTFNEYIQGLKNELIEVLNHAVYPYQKIYNKIRCSKNNIINAIPSTVFMVNQRAKQFIRFDQIPAQFVEYKPDVSEHHFSVELVFTEQQIMLLIGYDPKKFSKEKIDWFADQYVYLLHEVYTNPQKKLPSYIKPLPSISGNNHILNDKPIDIYGLLTNQLKHHAQAIAVVDEKKELTYAELHQQSTLWAQWICHHTSEKMQIRIVVCMNHRVDLIVMIWAIIKMGGTYIPIDPEYPNERIQTILFDIEPTYILTESRYIDRLKCLSSYSCVAVDELNLNDDDWPAQKKRRENHLAYIMYTSGTSGKPKGAMNTYGGLMNLILSLKKALQINEKTKTIQLSSISFDPSLIEIFVTLSAGGTLYLASSKTKYDLSALRRYIDQHQITMMCLPPALATLVNPGDFSSVTTLLLGGEALRANMLENTLSPKRNVYNIYGPTEATIAVCLHPISNSVDEPNVIGKALSHLKLYVVNENQQQVAPNESGELWISGIGVGLGYWNNEGLTQEKFRANPFVTEENNRRYPVVYKTGDKVQLRSDGTLLFLGRLDRQIKRHGFRIEPEEIENQLLMHPAIEQAKILLKTINQQEHLVAYYLSEEELNVQALKHYLAPKLPDYMIPQRFIFVQEMPLTLQGKIDHQALLTHDLIFEPGVYCQARNELEARIGRVWEEVLPKRPIGVEENFFELGGDSLSSIQLRAKLDEAGIHCTIEDLLYYPTIATLAKKIQSTVTLPDFDGVGLLKLRDIDLVPISRHTKNAPTLFLLPPVTGHASCFATLAQIKDYSIYSFHYPGYGTDPTLTSMKDLVERCIMLIQTIQPQGPYYLGGWSFGGMVSLAIAQQLTNQGESIKILLLMDSVWHPDLVFTDDELKEQLKLLVAHQHEGSQNRALIECNLKKARDLLQTFKMELYGGAAVLFEAQIKHQDNEDDLYKMMRYFSCLTIEEVPGSHYELFELNYQKTTRTQIQKTLDQLKMFEHIVDKEIEYEQ